VKPIDFASLFRREVWATILSIRGAENTLDNPLVSELCSRMKDADPASITVFLSRCPDSNEFEVYALDVLAKSRQRILMNGAARAVRIGTEGGDGLVRLREALEEVERRTAPEAGRLLDQDTLDAIARAGLGENEDRLITDIDNAMLFVKQFGADVKWVEELRKWCVWDGRRWMLGGDSIVRRHAQAVSNAIAGMLFGQAAKEGNPSKAKALASMGLSTKGTMRIANMLTEAKPHLVVPVKDLDRDVGFLTCANGVVDLSTGELLPFDRRRMTTRMTDVPYDPDADCPKWRRALAYLLGGDDEQVLWLKRAAGYSLTGRADAKMFAFLFGSGDNGKSTFLEVLKLVAGEYAQKTSVESVLSSGAAGEQKNTPYTAMLRGARLVVTDEMPQDRSLKASVIKDLTGGDTIAAMAKYQDPIQFRPTHFLWLYGNYTPNNPDDSEGMWQRVNLVRFPVSIPKDEQVPLEKLMEGFRSELPGILNWCVAGAMVAIAQGVGTTESIRAETQVYREEQDLMGQFIREQCEQHPDFRIPKKVLYSAYKEWCVGEGVGRPLSGKAFSRRMKRRGFEVGGHASGEYIGARLLGKRG